MLKISKNISNFSSQEVRKLFRKAKRVLRHPGLDVLCAPAALDFGRILVVTSRKVGNAPQRNLIRRRIKSLFYEQELYKRQVDMIIIIKKEGINLSFNELKDILWGVIKKYEKYSLKT